MDCKNCIPATGFYLGMTCPEFHRPFRNFKSNMKTIKKVDLIHEYVETMPKVMQQGVLYISAKYHTAIHLCLCGCGQQTVTPLNENGWSLFDVGNKITLTPSVGNYSFDCKSHYIITKSVANFV